MYQTYFHCYLLQIWNNFPSKYIWREYLKYIWKEYSKLVLFARATMSLSPVQGVSLSAKHSSVAPNLIATNEYSLPMPGSRYVRYLVGVIAWSANNGVKRVLWARSTMRRKHEQMLVTMSKLRLVINQKLDRTLFRLNWLRKTWSRYSH